MSSDYINRKMAHRNQYIQSKAVMKIREQATRRGENENLIKQQEEEEREDGEIEDDGIPFEDQEIDGMGFSEDEDEEQNNNNNDEEEEDGEPFEEDEEMDGEPF